MDSQRAREILLFYRPEGSDANAPEFREALEQVNRDPELRRWFESHCSRQSLIRDQFKQIPIPEGLRRRILEEVGQHAMVVWWQRPRVQALLAAAAAVILLLAGLNYFSREALERNDFAAYQNRIVRQVQRMYQMDMVTNDPVKIRQYLASQRCPADYVLTRPMQRLAAVGCAALEWRSNKVSLVCLTLGPQTDLYLFVIDRLALPDAPPTDANRPAVAAIGKWTAASWSHEGKTYILAGLGDERFVRAFLE